MCHQLLGGFQSHPWCHHQVICCSRCRRMGLLQDWLCHHHHHWCIGSLLRSSLHLQRGPYKKDQPPCLDGLQSVCSYQVMSGSVSSSVYGLFCPICVWVCVCAGGWVGGVGQYYANCAHRMKGTVSVSMARASASVEHARASVEHARTSCVMVHPNYLPQKIKEHLL